MGISETIIQFVLYEYFRSLINSDSTNLMNQEKNKFFTFMIAGGAAKFCACIMTYPHGNIIIFFFDIFKCCYFY